MELRDWFHSWFWKLGQIPHRIQVPRPINLLFLPYNLDTHPTLFCNNFYLCASSAWMSEVANLSFNNMQFVGRFEVFFIFFINIILYLACQIFAFNSLFLIWCYCMLILFCQWYIFLYQAAQIFLAINNFILRSHHL